MKPKNGDTLWATGTIMMFMLKTKGKKINATIKAQVNGFYQLSLIEDLPEKTKVEDNLVKMGLAEKETNLDSSMNAILVNMTTCFDSKK